MAALRYPRRVEPTPAPDGPARQLFPLREGVAPVVFEAEGFWHPGGALRRSGAFTRYDDVVHFAASTGGLWLGTRRGVWLLRGSLFRRDDPPEALAREIAARIAAAPRGAEQLSRMRAVGRVGTTGHGAQATWLVMLLCLAVFGLEATSVLFVHESGTFLPALVREGEWWRLVTANLLHGGPAHLVMNLLGLLVLGNLAARPLGFARTVVVMGAAALGSMGASLLSEANEVVGASGIVLGLAGAAVYLEWFRGDQLPATLRVPRRLFLVALAVDLLLGAVVPFIAGLAHLGGFLAGFVAAALVTPRSLFDPPPSRWAAAAATAVGVVVVASLAGAAALVVGRPSALVRHGERLLDVPDVHPMYLNNVAWRIATERPVTPDQLEVALEMAERAVDETQRSAPDILDTLAEIQWKAGRRDRAVHTIDEAIALAPQEPYFREQRRRFTGERAADDRPEPPDEDAPYRLPPAGPGLEPGRPPSPEPAGEDDGGVWI